MIFLNNSEKNEFFFILYTIQNQDINFFAIFKEVYINKFNDISINKRYRTFFQNDKACSTE